MKRGRLLIIIILTLSLLPYGGFQQAAADSTNNISAGASPSSIMLIPQDLNSYNKVSDKLLFRSGINTDLLYIAASAGGGFEKTPSYLGSNDKYGLNQKVKAYFSAYSNNQSAKRIFEAAMAMDNPPKKFVGDILHAALKYDDSLLTGKSYQGEEVLNYLHRFAEDSKAIDFFRSNRESYNKIMYDFSQLVNFDYIQRLEAFFGEQPKNASFEVVLSTVMDGGQATYLRKEDGSTIYYNIMNPGQSEGDILLTLYHETAHSFYDVRQRQSALVSEYSKYSNALGSYERNFGDQVNETITRAVTAILLEKYHPDLTPENNLKSFETQGFKNVHNIYKLIKNGYLPYQNRYKTFDSFVPVIFEYIKASSLNETFEITL